MMFVFLFVFKLLIFCHTCFIYLFFLGVLLSNSKTFNFTLKYFTMHLQKYEVFHNNNTTITLKN